MSSKIMPAKTLSAKIMSAKRLTLRAPAALALVLLLGACSLTPQINLTEYSPVIDLGGMDRAKYATDLEACRVLGLRAQARYKALREKEIGESIAATAIGAALGAGTGALVSRNTSRGAGIGAVTGAAIGGATASQNVDHTRDIAKFGPTIIVDRCMANRGYTILSNTGFGGG